MNYTINDVIHLLYPLVAGGMSLDAAMQGLASQTNGEIDPYIIDAYGWRSILEAWFSDFINSGGGGAQPPGPGTGEGGGGGGTAPPTNPPVEPDPDHTGGGVFPERPTNPTPPFNPDDIGNVSSVSVPGWLKVAIAGVGGAMTYIWIRPGSTLPPGGTPIYEADPPVPPDQPPPTTPPVVPPPYTPPPSRPPTSPWEPDPPPVVTPPPPTVPDTPPPVVPPPAPPVVPPAPVLPTLPGGSGGGSAAIPGGFPGPVGGGPVQSLFPIQMPGPSQIPLLAALLMRGQ